MGSQSREAILCRERVEHRKGKRRQGHATCGRLGECSRHPQETKTRAVRIACTRLHPAEIKKNLAHSLPKIFKSKARRTEMALEQTDFTTSLEAWAKI